MRSKRQRQKQILRIMEAGHFHTQQEVARTLRHRGFTVSQATLSKDFKDLNVVKTIAPDGTFKYVPPKQLSREVRPRSIRRDMEDFVLGFDVASNLVVLKTAPGDASGVCETIDRSGWTEVVGSIAGDNTILLVCKTDATAQRLATRIRTLIEGAGEAP